VFGAWQMKPEVSDAIEEDALAFGQAYGADPFSSYWWLKEWERFNDLLTEIIADKSVGSYVVSTDVANFYDSIEVPRLLARIRMIAHADVNTVEALNAFLSSWNRRHIGYMASTKGIPQEIISDASRVLSHFYLQDFDGEFGEYCNQNELQYVRWADDIMVFGSSYKKIQSAVHHVSRLMRDLGLNLNASKTKYMSKSALADYRCLDFVNAISQEDHSGVEMALKKIKRRMGKGEEFRLDTVFRAMIGSLNRHPVAQTTVNKAFLVDVGESNRDLLHSLNHTQMLRYIQLMDRPIVAFDKLRAQICAADFGAPKASYLHMMRKYRNQLATIGVSQKKALAAINQIEAASSDSEVLGRFCVPVVRDQYTK
ncbi:MAG: RNA-directed DNA polymerase, partial [Roseicyclus sp.]